MSQFRLENMDNERAWRWRLVWRSKSPSGIWDSMAFGNDLPDVIKLPCPVDNYQRMYDM
jgi:hypothetical protein